MSTRNTCKTHTHGKILVQVRVWLFGPKILASPSASYSRVHSWSALHDSHDLSAVGGSHPTEAVLVESPLKSRYSLPVSRLHQLASPPLNPMHLNPAQIRKEF